MVISIKLLMTSYTRTQEPVNSSDAILLSPPSASTRALAKSPVDSSTTKPKDAEAWTRVAWLQRSP